MLAYPVFNGSMCTEQMHIFRVFSQAYIWDQRVHRRHLWSSVDQCTLTDTLYQPSMNSQLIVDGHL